MEFSMQEFTHIDDKGRVRMVDVTDKAQTLRIAVAQGIVSMNPATFEMIYNQTVKKGNVLETARVAGVMAAKKTSELIPMCHQLNITHISVDFFPEKEINAIRKACKKLKTFNLSGCTIYTTCKPCPMCLGAIFWARIKTVYYGATDKDAAKAGFDDKLFYDMLKKDSNGLKLKQIDSKTNAKLFDMWIEKNDKKMY